MYGACRHICITCYRDQSRHEPRVEGQGFDGTSASTMLRIIINPSIETYVGRRQDWERFGKNLEVSNITG